MKSNKKIKFTTVLLLVGFIPLICTSILVCIMMHIKISDKLQQDVYDQLYVAADGLRQYYQYDIEKGGIESVEYEHDYVDMLTDKDIQMTLFIDDTRFITSAKNEKGERNENTKMDSTIWGKVKNGETYYGSGVKIGGKDYFVCYIPLRDAENKVVGSAWAGIPDTDVNASITSILVTMIIISVIAVTIFGAIILVVAFRIINIFKGMSTEVASLSNGLLTSDNKVTSIIKEIDTVSKDTISLRERLYSIVNDINNSATELNKQSENVNDAIESANSTIDNLNSAAEEIANGATSMANDVQTASENVLSVSESINNINNSITDVDKLSDTMMNNSNVASENVEELIDETIKSIKDLNEISEKMSLVADAVDEVVSAALEINSIASQTNLLSLNASIEAARAGDAGRGFAVVAGEISTLAEQSNKAAKTIQEIMNNLKNQTTDAVNSIDRLSKIMSKQGEISEKSKNSIGILIDSINKTNDSISNIKEKADSVTRECDSLNSVIQNLSALSEENAATAEETAASIQVVSTSMGDIAESSNGVKVTSDSLGEIIKFFKL